MKSNNRSLFLLPFALALAVTSAEAFAKKNADSDSKKSKSHKSGDSNAERSSPSYSRASHLNSLEARTQFGSAISNTQSSELLSVKHAGKVRGGTTKVEKTQTPNEDTQKSYKKLNLGVFRSEQLSSGTVAAPGVADFAAYFRADPAQKQAEAKDVAEKRQGILGATSADELKKQAEAESLRVQTVESIRQILKTKPSADQRFTLMMRLAELEIERHAYALELEIKEFNEAHEKWKASAKGAEPTFKTTNSNSHLLGAVETLRTLATQFPNHARAPEVLFNLGFLLTQMQNDSAVLYFDRLIKRFPKSDYIPDTYLALGEYHFSKEQFDKALSFYQKVLNYKDTRAYNYSVYKIGWTYFNLRGNAKETERNLQKSLSAFRLVVKLAETTGDPVLKDLRKEALKDLVIVFADIGDVDTAQKYYESLGEPELYLTLLERLAWQHSENGNYDKSVAIYERLIEEAGSHTRLPSFYAKVPDLLEKQHKRGKMVQFLAEMTRELGPNSKWVEANKANPEALKEKDRILAKELIGWASRIHFEAQKTQRDNTFNEALAIYSLYLDQYGELATAYNAHFYKAEILVHKNKYVDAADSYLKAVALDEKFALKGKFTRDALLNAVQSVDATLAKMPQVKLAEAGRASQKIPLTAMHERLVRALDAFTRIFPNDERSLELAHRAASIVYAFGDYPDANARWTALANRHPRSEEVFDGARLVLKVPVFRLDWTSAIVESRKFLAIKGVKETKLGKELTVILKGSVFQKALALEKAEKRAEAAELFLAYHKEFQDDADAPKALFNAANNKFRVGKVDEAISALRVLLAQYPNSNLAPHSLYLIATSYDALGEFAQSAASYEQLASDVPNSPVTDEALASAAQHRLAIGDSVQAIKNASTLIEKYPSSDKFDVAYLSMGKAYLKMNNLKMAAKTFSQGADYFAGSKPTTSLLLYGMAAQASLQEGNEALAQSYIKRGEHTLAALPEKGRDANASEGTRLIGMTQVALLDAKLPALYKQGITNSAQLNVQFAKIRDEVQKLASRYVAVAKLGNAEAGIGALYRVAEMQEFLGTVLLKAPAPANAKAEEIATFRSGLERIAIPLQEEAGNLYMTAWQKANETEAMTPYTRKLYEKLVVLKPADFKPVVEDLPPPSYFASEVQVMPETKKLMKE